MDTAQYFFRMRCADVDTASETLWVAHLDWAYNCVHLSRHEGNETSAPFPLKSIVHDALKFRSRGIVLAHNHPSRDVGPSESDLDATRRLALVCDALECPLLDHLILGGDQCISFRSLGLL